MIQATRSGKQNITEDRRAETPSIKYFPTAAPSKECARKPNKRFMFSKYLWIFLLQISLTLAVEAKTVDVTLTPCAAPSQMPTIMAAWPKSEDRPALWGYFPRPPYPIDLERAGVSGEVLVEFAVNQYGWVVYAGITQASDIRFADTVLATLRSYRPSLNGAPMQPCRLTLPIKFTPTTDSEVRDKKLTGNIKTAAVATKPIAFTRDVNFNPLYPGFTQARKLLKNGMSEITICEIIGWPSSTVDYADGVKVLRYGDLLEPEFGVFLEKNRMVSTDVFKIKRR